MQRTEQVKFVVRCFKDMGATKDQLAKERSILEKDDEYLHTWLETAGFSKWQTKKSPWRALLDVMLLKA